MITHPSSSEIIITALSVVREQPQELGPEGCLEVGGVLHAVLLDAATVVLDQVIDWLHTTFLGLRRVNCAGRHMLFPRFFLLQLGLEAG